MKSRHSRTYIQMYYIASRFKLSISKDDGLFYATIHTYDGELIAEASAGKLDAAIEWAFMKVGGYDEAQ